jgi:hypothetical protein
MYVRVFRGLVYAHASVKMRACVHAKRPAGGVYARKQMQASLRAT